MARYVAAIPSSWCVEEAFSYMSDLANARFWDPSVVSAFRIDDGQLVVNTEFELTVRFAGRNKTLRYRVTSLEAPRATTFEATSGSLVSVDVLTFEPRANGCLVTYNAELRLRGVASVANPLLGVMFRRLGDRARDSLREILGGPRAAS